MIPLPFRVEVLWFVSKARRRPMCLSSGGGHVVAGSVLLPFPIQCLIRRHHRPWSKELPPCGLPLAGKALSSHGQPLKIGQPALSLHLPGRVQSVPVFTVPPKCNYTHPFSAWGHQAATHCLYSGELSPGPALPVPLRSCPGKAPCPCPLIADE